MDDPIADGMNAAGNLLNTEPVKNLLSPVTNEVGLVLGSIGSLVRFYCEDNLQKVFTKWARQRNGKPLEPSEFVRVIPLLQAASLVSDDDLQERWAALLESSVSGPDGVLPSFGQTLSQLTAEEAKYIGVIYRFAAAHNELNEDGSLAIGNMDAMFEIYNPEFRIAYGENSDEMASQLESRTNRLMLLLADLERLGLVLCERVTKQLAQAITITELRTGYSFSAYGVSFVKAVNQKV